MPLDLPANLVLVLAVLAVAVVLGVLWQRANGRYRAVPPRVMEAASHLAPSDDHRLTAADLGAPLGSTATFLQLSSEMCAPCRRAAVVLRDVAQQRPGVAHVEVDVEERLDLVRRFGVLRTPTVMVLDGDGVVVGRMSGAMSRHHALAALESCPGGARAR